MRFSCGPARGHTDNIDYDRFPWLRSSKVLSNEELEQWKNVTTVMMRNLPNKYQRDMLRRDLDRDGFADKYDFFYLPRRSAEQIQQDCDDILDDLCPGVRASYDP